MSSVISSFAAKLRANPVWMAYLGVAIVAIVLRLWAAPATPLAFDQVQILQNAEQIYSGSPVLIGPRTGPADMFTGPLVYYLTAALMFIVPAPYTVIALALVCSLATGVTLAWLANHYRDQQWSLLIFGVWAVSPFIVSLDRIPWNPNLSILAAALCLFPVAQAQKRLSKLDLGFIFAGSFLGYQAHFSGLLLPGLVVATLLMHRQWRSAAWAVVAASLGLATSFLPTLVFDIRNNWLNLQGLQELLTNRDAVHSFRLGARLQHQLFIVIETLGKLLFFYASTPLIIVAGIGLVIADVWKTSTSTAWRSERTTIWLWALLTPLAFSFYRGSTPEYYYLILIPAFLLLITRWLLTLPSATARWSLITGLAVVTLWNQTYLLESRDLDLFNSVKVQEIVQENATSEVRYDIEAVETLGLQYLLAGKELTPGEPVTHIMYPYSGSVLSERISPSVAIWFDDRDLESTWIQEDDYLLEVKQPWRIWIDLQSAFSRLPATTYLIADEQDRPQASLLVTDKEIVPETKDLEGKDVCTISPTWQELCQDFPPRYQTILMTWQFNDFIFLLLADSEESADDIADAVRISQE